MADEGSSAGGDGDASQAGEREGAVGSGGDTLVPSVETGAVDASGAGDAAAGDAAPADAGAGSAAVAAAAADTEDGDPASIGRAAGTGDAYSGRDTRGLAQAINASIQAAVRAGDVEGLRRNAAAAAQRISAGMARDAAASTAALGGAGAGTTGEATLTLEERIARAVEVPPKVGPSLTGDWRIDGTFLLNGFGSYHYTMQLLHGEDDTVVGRVEIPWVLECLGSVQPCPSAEAAAHLDELWGTPAILPAGGNDEALQARRIFDEAAAAGETALVLHFLQYSPGSRYRNNCRAVVRSLSADRFRGVWFGGQRKSDPWATTCSECGVFVATRLNHEHI